MELADQISKELFSKLMEELKFDMEFLLLNDPRVGNMMQSTNSKNDNWLKLLL